MKISKNGQMEKTRAIRSSMIVGASAAVLLGLYLNKNVVEADSLTGDQNIMQSSIKADTKKGISVSQSANQNSQDDVNSTKKESAVSKKSTTSELDSNLQSNTTESTSNEATNQATVKASDLTRAKIREVSWIGLKATFDDENKELTILGGTNDQPVILDNPAGEFRSWDPFYWYDNLTKNSIEKITINGKIRVIGDATYLFGDYDNLKMISGLEQLDTSQVTNMSYLFNNDSSLTSLDVSHFDTSQVKSMVFMFCDCKGITSLDVSHFNTKNVSQMDGVFNDCSGLTSLDLRSFDTSQVTSMYDMFDSCSSLTSLDLSSFDMNKNDNDYRMLTRLSSLKKIVLGPKFKFRRDRWGDTDDIEHKFCQWINVGDGTTENARGKSRTLLDILLNYNGITDHGTYIHVGTVRVYYCDENYRKIADHQDFMGELGTSYIKVGQKDLPGYTLKEIKGDSTGTYTDVPKKVVYIYTKNPVKPAEPTTSTITVHYQDEQGNKIAPDEILSGKVGESYQSKQKDLPGYTFKEIKGDSTGTYTDEPKEVVYIYTKNPVKPAEPTTSTITVHYQDEQGNKIAPDEILSGKVGESYQSKQKDLPGYTFKEIKGKPVGYFTTSEQMITYIYIKNEVGSEGQASITLGVTRRRDQTKEKSKKVDGQALISNRLKTGKIKNLVVVRNKKIKIKQLATKASSSSKQKQDVNLLPQTGADQKHIAIWTILGNLMLSISYVLGGLLKRRKK